MRTFAYLISSFCILLFLSCSKKENDKGKQNVIESYDFETTFPFSSAKKVILISYPDRMLWDTVVKGPDQMYTQIIENGKLKIDTSRIIDKAYLDKNQTKKLFDLLYNYKCKDTMIAACYMPRHAFVFYDDKDKAYASIEICFGCMRSNESKGVKEFMYCEKQIADLQTFSESVGVRSEVSDETATNSHHD